MTINEGNVAALEKAITAIRDAAAGFGAGDEVYLSDRTLAEALAREGILAPESLTNADTLRVTDLGWPDRKDPDRYSPAVADVIRYELAKIAKGEE